MAAKRCIANHVVDVSEDETIDLLQRGQSVETPLGSGVIEDIAIQAGKYGKRYELEPPLIQVRLDDPEDGKPDVIHVCMCKLGLDNPVHEAIISKEFGRLWPPITDDVQEDTHMLVDLKKKETDEIRARFEKLSSTAHRVASTAIRQRRQRRVYSDYAKLAIALVEPVVATMKELTPGMVITGAEGLNFGEGAHVVLQTLPVEGRDDSQMYLVLYSPDEDALQHMTAPGDSKFMGHPGEEATGLTPTVEDDFPGSAPPMGGDPPGFTPTVYDPSALGTEQHQIRILPDSYLPKNPNYPSSITDTVWRPTVRQTPIRFYETKKEGAFDRKPGQERGSVPTGQDVNYATPDTVNPDDLELNPTYKKPLLGKDAYDPVIQQQITTEEGAQPTFDEKMEELRAQLWAGYQGDREEKIPGWGNTLDLDFLAYFESFIGKKELDQEDAFKLLNYMVIKADIPESVLKTYQQMLNNSFTLRDLRTHFTNK